MANTTSAPVIDHRNKLVDGVNSGNADTGRVEQVIVFDDHEPTSTRDFASTQDSVSTQHSARTWSTRGEHWVLEYAVVSGRHALSERVLEREHLIVALDAPSEVTVTLNGSSSTHAGYSVVVVPPGVVSGSLSGPGRFVRLFTLEADDLVDSSINADFYAALTTPTPSDPAPIRAKAATVRAHSLDAPQVGDRFGRIFTTADLMINLLQPRVGPRDPGTLSPHMHPTFEQSSFVTDGEYVHHLRWPWGVDRRLWRDDRHLQVGSPSVTVIPPGCTHTSEAIDDGLNLIIDIFGPPRADWRKAGWVLNESDYESLDA